MKLPDPIEKARARMFGDRWPEPLRLAVRSVIGDYAKLGLARGYVFDENAKINPAKDNEADAFRHAFTAAILTSKLFLYISEPIATQAEPQALRAADIITDFLGYVRKKKVSPNDGVHVVNMDLWNEAVGRQIAVDLIREKKITKNLKATEIKNILADKIDEAIKAQKTINSIPDPQNRRYASRFEKASTEGALKQTLETECRNAPTGGPDLITLCKTAWAELAKELNLSRQLSH